MYLFVNKNLSKNDKIFLLHRKMRIGIIILKSTLGGYFMTILIDMDDVLVNTTEAWVAHLNALFGTHVL